MQSQVGLFPSYLKLDKMLLKELMAMQEWPLSGSSPNFMYHQIQTPENLKSHWKYFLISFGRNLMISRIRLDPMDIVLEDS